MDQALAFAPEAPYMHQAAAQPATGPTQQPGMTPSEYGGGLMKAEQQQDAPSAGGQGAAAAAAAPAPGAPAAAAAAAAAGEPSTSAASKGAAADATAAAAGAAAADDGGGGGDASALQPVQQPAKAQEQLSYAAIREAEAVNQAADGAADEAMRAVAAAQATIAAMYNQPVPDADASAGGHHHHHHHAAGGSRSRSRRSAAAAAAATYADAAAAYGLPGIYVGGGGGGGRPNKGLRHFSMKVCEKVESKGTTTYNEVADELVAELKGGMLDDGICYDEKNIRRRVYDAINVLMALDIIAKEKKAIIWRGFPTTRSAAQQASRLQGEQLALMGELNRKSQFLAELVEQQKALRHLLQRNADQPTGEKPRGTALHLPFVLVQSRPEATVEVQISPEMREVQFNFYNYPFQLHDDALVLRKMLEQDNHAKLTAVAHGQSLGYNQQQAPQQVPQQPQQHAPDESMDVEDAQPPPQQQQAHAADAAAAGAAALAAVAAAAAAAAAAGGGDAMME